MIGVSGVLISSWFNLLHILIGVSKCLLEEMESKLCDTVNTLFFLINEGEQAVCN